MTFFKHFTKYMKWDNRGVIAAINSWKREDIERSEYPQKAYELGKSF